MAASPSISSIYVFFAFDIGHLIDLKVAGELAASVARPQQLSGSRYQESLFGYQPAPLAIPGEESDGAAIAGRRGRMSVESRVWDFGAITVSLKFMPTESIGISSLPELSWELVDDVELADVARGIARTISEKIAPGIVRPEFSDVYEDFILYELTGFEDSDPVRTLIEANSQVIAQALRAERGHLSQEVMHDALQCRASFSPQDMIVVDWNAGVMCGPLNSDVRSVVEFAQAQLLEMRILDAQLDKSLETTYAAFAKRKGARALSLSSVALLHVDAAASFEAVRGALKLVGDQYLARVYKLCAERFEFGTHVEGITRKLNALDSIYQKIVDRQDKFRAELLEIAIIALFLYEIVQAALSSHK